MFVFVCVCKYDFIVVKFKILEAGYCLLNPHKNNIKEKNEKQKINKKCYEYHAESIIRNEFKCFYFDNSDQHKKSKNGNVKIIHGNQTNTKLDRLSKRKRKRKQI